MPYNSEVIIYQQVSIRNLQKRRYNYQRWVKRWVIFHSKF